MLIDIDLHTYRHNIKIKKDQGKVFIYDIIRKKYLQLQPEELVRQLTIHYLIDNGYPPEKIQLERGLVVNQTQRRYDIVVYDKAFEPFLLIECKSHKVPITQAVFDQIAKYNMEMTAPYILVTNGVQTYCCEISFKTNSYTYLSNIPEY